MRIPTGWLTKMTGASTLGLSDKRGSSRELSDAIYDAVQPYMVAQAWNGEDITMSAVALTQAVDAMAETAEEYILTNCPPAGSGEDAGVEEPVQGSVTMQYVFDAADLLPLREVGKTGGSGRNYFPKAGLRRLFCSCG